MPGMSHVAGTVVYCLDLARMRAFYAGLGALELIDDGPGFVVLGLEDVEVSLVQASPEAVAAFGALSVPVERRVDNPVKLVLPVDSLEKARAAAPDLGGLVDPESCTWSFRGGRICDGQDPEGNVVAFREPA
jgi:catechol 2,3-dioxygenase-like lactoylglutathione lyase family enzyme